jgi:prepilin-type N-terminal cleavage/methylation domain-containing protein
MKKKNFIICCHTRGFTLAEVLAALTIGAMVLVSVLSVYMRADDSARSVMSKLDRPLLASEVLQRIVEDLDSIISAGKETKITIPQNKIVNGYMSSRLESLRTFYDETNKPQKYEEIIWQTYPDDEGNGLILYRSHSGMVMEDKLLDSQKDQWERELFVPICEGLTLFKVEVPSEEEILDKWTSQNLPTGIIITISFGEPYKTVSGELEVDEFDKVTRTIAIDRARKIGFSLVPMVKGVFDEDPNSKAPEDPNSAIDPNAPKALIPNL